jgi:hypothetical protein
VIASLDDIIENEESDPEIYMREISSEKAEDESVNIDDTIESLKMLYCPSVLNCFDFH